MPQLQSLNGIRALAMLAVMMSTMHQALVVPYANRHYDDVSEEEEDYDESALEEYHRQGYLQSFCGEGMYALSAGRHAVPVFFVLSGFLITYQLCERLKRAGRHASRPRNMMFAWFYFVLRRLFRLLPALMIVAPVVAYAGPLAPPFQYGSPERGLMRVFSFFPARAPFATDDWLMPWTWTLSVQWTFYLLLFPLVVLARRALGAGRLAHVMWALCVPCVLFKLTLASFVRGSRADAVSLLDATAPERRLLEEAHFNVLGHMAALLMGAGLAAHVSEHPADAVSPQGTTGSLSPLAILAVAGTLVWQEREQGPWNRTLVGCGHRDLVSGAWVELCVALSTVVLVRDMLAVEARLHGALRDAWKPGMVARVMQRLLSAPPLQYLARISYATFLVHPVVAYVVFDLDLLHLELVYTAWEVLVRLVISCIITFPLAHLVRVLAEEPGMAMRGDIFPMSHSKKTQQDPPQDAPNDTPSSKPSANGGENGTRKRVLPDE